ncbi:MAG TPA: 3-hydroxyacyl-CoA dehydrogenase NAD-binding domain-containing protein [Candidatus Limnocylindria bacterium]|nr:3-hydroxyacyl-CoA dehydrogenase NAD-binding domain-containing protein [Candidatus Limnocylindria bacterium]
MTDRRQRNVLVCGAGLMGHGIAQVLAGAGHRVWLFEPEVARAEAGRARIGANLERAVDKGRMTEDERQALLGRISIAPSLAKAAAQAQLVIEAAFEDEDVKRGLFRELDRAAAPGTLLASNTSSISITRLATALAPERRARFVGLHFFSPVPVMPLIELIRGADTDDATEAEARELAAELGKQVIVSRDRPGFIVNRMLMPLLAEAMRAYEENLATAEDIDAGARLGLNHPMGPLELADFIGLDVCLQIMQVLHEGFGQPYLAPPPILRQLVDAGRLGQKSGQGFYRYPRD